MKRSNRLVLLVGVFLAVVAFVGIVLVQDRGHFVALPTKSLPYHAELRLEGNPERWTIVERYVLRATDESPQDTMESLGAIPPGWREEPPDHGVQVIVSTGTLSMPATSLLTRTAWTTFRPTTLDGVGVLFYPDAESTVSILAPTYGVIRTEPASTGASSDRGTNERREIKVGGTFSRGSESIEVQTTATTDPNAVLYGLANLSGEGMLSASILGLWAIVLGLFKDAVKNLIKWRIGHLRPEPSSGKRRRVPERPSRRDTDAI